MADICFSTWLLNKHFIMKIGIVQHSFSEDPATNRARNLAAIRSLADDGARLVVLPELHDSLYFCQTEDVSNFSYAQPYPGEFFDIYSRAAAENGVVLVASGFERRAPGLYHNTAVVFEKDGSVAGQYRKMHIPDDPGFYEKFYFTPGDMGFHPIETSLGRLGVLVCWDQWYPEAARLMALDGADLLIYPTAIGWNPDDAPDEKARQREAWITVQRGHAVANGIPVVSVNRVGYEEDPSGASSGIDFWGSSFVCGPQGEFLTLAPDDRQAEEIVDVDLRHCENVRQWWPFLRDRRIDAYADLTKRFLR